MKCKGALFVLGMLFLSLSVLSQTKEPEKDTLNSKKKLELTLDIVSRYLWRGQCWGGDYVAVQPAVSYEVFPNWKAELWATTNFKSDYAYPDGTANKGYQELDLSISYTVDDVLKFQVSDYYWPSVEKVPGVDNGYFNYGNDGVKTVDASVVLDLSENEDCKYPFNATISTLVAGNDYRYDSNGENPKQNFTTYMEVGYTFTFFEEKKLEMSLSPVIGAVLNNKAEYYSYADYDEASFCNMGFEIEKEFKLTEKIKMPLKLNFTHNAARKNTEDFGKNFLVFGLSFKY